ncbi:MAG TPA: hypothetical protein VN844_01475, partial [Pyrinomonadaceae bacterium]|nr:hypothetical protein [Pyrinomonadaceae bacterium]
LLSSVCRICETDLNSVEAILDPFTGVATSLLSAQLEYRGKHNLKLVGIERNPFVASVARAKLNWPTYDIQRIKGAIPELVDFVRTRTTRDFELPELSTLQDERVMHRRRLYDLMFARDLIDGAVQLGPERDFFLLGWASTIESASNVRKDGRALRFVNKENRQPVYKHLKAKWLEMASDLENCSKVLSNVKRGEITSSIIESDGRSLEALNASDTRFDLVLYSPPYLNNLDYSEVYKMELWLSKAVTSNAQFRRLRLQTLRSHPSVTFPETYLVDHLPVSAWSKRLRNALIESLPRDRRRKERIRTIRAYMDDILLSLRNQFVFTRPGAPVVCVIGNSIHGKKRQPIPIATDLLIASLGIEAGFLIDRLYVTRYTRRRDYRKRLLREGILIMRRPHNKK